jgi:hypothetical protein
MRLIFAADKRGDGRDGDDRAAMTLFHHLLRGRLHHEIGAVQIDLEGALHVSTGMSRKAWNGQMPAFDTITSTLPKASTAFATKACAVCGSATSPFTAIARWPSASISATQLCGRTIAAGIVDDDVGTMLRGADGGGAADAGRCAGDEDGLAFKQLHGASFSTCKSAPRGAAAVV